MPTQTEINGGMGLDQILGTEAPAEVFASLKSTAVDDLDNSLNPNVEGGISELLEMFLNAPDDDQGLIADAICDLLSHSKTKIDTAISDDLDAQQAFRDEQEEIDLTSQILPTDLQPELLDLVTTDAFKTAVAQSDEISG